MATASFNQLHSRSLRFWHWLTFIVILLILFTVFTGKLYVNPFSTAPKIQQALHNEGITITNEQAFKSVNGLDAGIWLWHQRYGYVLSFLFLFRIVLEFFQPSDQKFLNRTRGSLSSIKAKDGKSSVHYFIVRVIYLLFYLLLTTIVATGLTMSFLKNQLSTEKMHSIKEVHESCFYLLLLFVLVHITGVLLAERKHYRNIVSGMIHGG